MTAKTCTVCKKKLSFELFHRDARSKDGRRPRCKRCISACAARDAKKPPEVDPTVTHKCCPRCERLERQSVHPVGEFGVARRRKDGRNSWCRACCTEVSGAWQRTESGRVKHIEAVKRYNEKKRRERLSSGA